MIHETQKITIQLEMLFSMLTGTMANNFSEKELADEIIEMLCSHLVNMGAFVILNNNQEAVDLDKYAPAAKAITTSFMQMVDDMEDVGRQDLLPIIKAEKYKPIITLGIANICKQVQDIYNNKSSLIIS